MKEEDIREDGENSGHEGASEASETDDACAQSPEIEIVRDASGPQVDAERTDTEDEEAEAREDKFWALIRTCLASAPRTSFGRSVSEENDGSPYIVHRNNSFTLHPPSARTDRKKLIRRLKNRLPVELVEYVGVNALRCYPLEELCERFFWYVGFQLDKTVYFGEWDDLPHSVEQLRDRMLIDAASNLFPSLNAQRPDGGTMVSAAPIDVIRALLLRGYYVTHDLDCIGLSGRLVARAYKEHKERTSGTSAEKRNDKPEQDPAAAEECLEKPEDKAKNEMHYDRTSKTWHVTFKGERLPEMKHLEGLWYIAQVLNHPNELISSHDLRQARLQKSIPLSGKIDTVTLEALREFKWRRTALRAAIEKEKSDQNFTVMKEHQAELEQLDEQIEKVTNRHGKPRSADPELEKSRKLVSRNMKNARDKIEKISEELAAYLLRTIFPGQMVIYIPEGDTSFDVSL